MQILSARAFSTPKLVFAVQDSKSEIGTVFGSDQQLVGKAVDDFQARVSRASVDDNYLNSAVLLIHDRLEGGSEPSLAVIAGYDHGQPGLLHYRNHLSAEW
jgi:hypothetical protein